MCHTTQDIMVKFIYMLVIMTIMMVLPLFTSHKVRITGVKTYLLKNILIRQISTLMSSGDLNIDLSEK